jgi:hypothetical protein
MPQREKITKLLDPQTKKKRGRPIGPQTKNLSINLRQGEFDTLKVAAASRGLAMAEIVRSGIQKELRDYSREAQSDSERQQVIRERLSAVIPEMCKVIIAIAGDATLSIEPEEIERVCENLRTFCARPTQIRSIERREYDSDRE